MSYELRLMPSVTWKAGGITLRHSNLLAFRMRNYIEELSFG